MRRVWAAVLDMVFIFIFFLLVNIALGVWGLLRGGFLLSGRNLAVLLNTFSLVIYVCCRGIMPYDGWLNMYVEEE